MMTSEIIAAIDAEIQKLQQVKALLNGSGDHSGAGSPSARRQKLTPVKFRLKNH